MPAEGDLDFALHPGDEVVGRVVSADGGPVPGAFVSALAHTREPGSDSAMDHRSTRSGPDGRFRLTSLRRDLGAHTLVAQARGHGKLLLDFGPAPGEAGRIDLGDVRLPVSRSIEGRVTDADGAPLPGAAVELRSLEEHAIPEFYGGREERRTDDLGRFRFPDLSPGRYRILLDARGRPLATKDVVLPEDRDVRDVALRLEAGAKLVVRVLDPEGAPVSGVFVLADVSSAMGNVSARTGEDGRAVLTGLPEEDLWFYVFLSGVGPEPPFLRPEPFRATPRGQEVVVRLRPAVFAKGVVLSPDGAPLSRMWIRVYDRDGKERSELAGATEDSGRFDLRLPPEERFVLVVDGSVVRSAPVAAQADPWRPVGGRLEGVVGPAEGLVLRTAAVETDRALTVRVLDPEGRPAPGVRVAIAGPAGEREQPAGDDGRARFAGLPNLGVTVRACAPEGADLPDGTVNPREREVVPAGQEVELRLRPGVPLAGTVVDPGGKPVEGASVTIRTGDGVWQETRTDATGRFEARALTGASHTVQVQAPGPGGRRVTTVVHDVRPEDGDVDVVLHESR